MDRLNCPKCKCDHTYSIPNKRLRRLCVMCQHSWTVKNVKVKVAH